MKRLLKPSSFPWKLALLLAVLPNVGEAKPDWEAIREVALAMGVGLDYLSVREVMEEISQKVPGYSGMTYESLGEHGRKLKNED